MQMDRGRGTLDTVLEKHINSEQITESRDRKFIHALIHGVLRWQARLDGIIDRVSRRPAHRLDPEIRILLRLGLFQIFFFDRVPPSAAVNTSVNLARSITGRKATGFVNAVLRNAIRQRETLVFPDAAADPVAALAARQSFAPWMIKRWIARRGLDDTLARCQALNTVAPLTLRTNTLRAARWMVIDTLTAGGEKPAPTPHSSTGICINRPTRAVPDLPGFTDGHFQVQDEAAQLVTFLLDPRPGERILDACAGLGGKTGHIVQQMKNRGQIVAVDRQAARLNQLTAEMRRLGGTIVETRTRDLETPAVLDDLGLFDRVLIDAPCSGLGVLRRHPDAKWHHSVDTLKKMARRQGRLLRHLSTQVKPGGVLVYAVCTTEPEENEDVIIRFLNGHPDFSLVPAARFLPDAAPPLAGADGFFRTFPHLHAMDGFFAARLHRSGAS